MAVDEEQTPPRCCTPTGERSKYIYKKNILTYVYGGRKEGRKGGRKEGTKERRKVGRNEGRKEGRNEGRKEGTKGRRNGVRNDEKEGRKEGREEGTKDRREEGEPPTPEKPTAAPTAERVRDSYRRCWIAARDGVGRGGTIVDYRLYCCYTNAVQVPRAVGWL